MGRGARIAHQHHAVAPSASIAWSRDELATAIQTAREDGWTLDRFASAASRSGLLELPESAIANSASSLWDSETPQRLADFLSAVSDTYYDRGRTPEEPVETTLPAAAQRAAAVQVLDALADEHAHSLDAAEAARTRAELAHSDADSYVQHPELFQAAYQQAREQVTAGQQPVPYMTQDATGGLGAREGGRGFGVELEFDLPAHMGSTERAEAIQAIGRDLHAAGLSTSPYQQGYHASLQAGYSDNPGAWRLEQDGTVAGEIVSPIMYDEPGTWENLARVCEIVRRHGGVASINTGGHVHVGLHDYDHTVENHNRLMHTVAAYEDVLFRLAQNPERGEHRGLEWCRPNYVPDEGYESVTDVNLYNFGHELAVNLGSVTGAARDHAEFRMWDGSLEPAVIQTQIKVSLGLTDYALRTAGADPPLSGVRHDLGSHRSRFGRRRLSGERWRESTSAFRHLADHIFTRPADRAQATALFAATRWQNP